MLNVSMMPEEEVTSNWDRYRSWLVDSVSSAHPFETIERVDDGICEGRLVLWAGKSGLAVARIEEYERAKVLHLQYLAGDPPKVLRDGMEQFENCARHLGCGYIMVQTNPVHAKRIKALGFKPSFTTLLKPVGQESPNAEAS